MWPSKASIYAILVVAEIAKRARTGAPGIRAAHIANEFDLPAAYVAKVLTRLARAQILASERGPRGGFRLAKQPAEIQFLEIVEAVDGDLAPEGVDLGTDGARTLIEAARAVFAEALDSTRQSLRGKSVASLLEDCSAPAPCPTL